MLAVKGFNEISYDELMDVNGGDGLNDFVNGCLIAITAVSAVALAPVTMPSIAVEALMATAILGGTLAGCGLGEMITESQSN